MLKRLISIIIYMCCALSTNAQLTNGLIAHWNFNSNVNDASGNGLNGTPFNITYTTGKAGIPNTAAKFNGTNSYIDVAYNSILNNAQFSITAMVKVEGYYNGLCQANALLWRGSQFTNGYYSLLFFDNPYVSSCTTKDTSKNVFAGQFGNLMTGSGTQWQYLPTIVSQKWYCVVTTYNGTQSKVYIDGVLKSTYTVGAGSIGTSTEGLGIGANIFANTGRFPYWFNGALDDLRLYNRALSQTDIDSFCNLFSAPAPTPEVSISQPVSKTSFCPQDNFQLHYTVTAPFNTGNVFTAQLSDAAGSFASPVSIGAITATGAGFINCTIPANTPQGIGYRVRVAASNPAKNSADNGVNLTVYSAAHLTLGTNPVCVGDTLKLYATVTPAGTKINWTGPNGFKDTLKTVIIPNAAYSDSGKYIVTANYNGCIARDTIEAIVGDVKFKLGNDTTICNNQSILLYTGVKGASHIWQDGSTLDSLFVQYSGIYSVTAKLGSCAHSDTINIEVQQVELTLPEDTSFCPYTSITIDITDTFDNYQWSVAGNIPSIIIDKSGTYWLEVTKGKCSASDTMEVKELEPYFLLGNDTLLCNGSLLVLHAQSLPGSKYTWQDGSNDSTYTVKEKGQYHATAENQCGTFGSNIQVDYFACKCDPFMPNAFTPDGNGLNDKIGPLMDCTPKEFKFIIASRWGEVVFETEVFGEKWDGRYKTIPSGMDTYFYLIQITDVLGHTTWHKGDFLLMR